MVLVKESNGIGENGPGLGSQAYSLLGHVSGTCPTPGPGVSSLPSGLREAGIAFRGRKGPRTLRPAQRGNCFFSGGGGPRASFSLSLSLPCPPFPCGGGGRSGGSG